MTPTTSTTINGGNLYVCGGQAGVKERRVKEEWRQHRQLDGQNTDNLARHANKLQTSELCFLILNCIL